MLIIFGTLMYSVHFKGGNDVTVGSAIRLYTQSRASIGQRSSLGRRSTVSAVSSVESGAQSQSKHRKSIGSVDSEEDEVRRSIRAVQLEEEINNDKANKVNFSDSTLKFQALKLNNEVEDSDDNEGLERLQTEYDDDDSQPPGKSPTMSRNSLCTGVLTVANDVALDQNQSE